MATTTTTLTPPGEIFPYGTFEASQSYYPRGEIRFCFQDETITAGGTGNEQGIVIHCNLPRNFSYRMRDAFLSVGVDTGAPNWSTQASIRITDGATAVRKTNYNIPFNSAGSLGFELTNLGSDGLNYSIPPGALPSPVMIPQPGGGAFASVSVFNATQDDPAGAMWGCFTFLMYDINQAFDATVNTPMPTVSR